MSRTFRDAEALLNMYRRPKHHSNYKRLDSSNEFEDDDVLLRKHNRNKSAKKHIPTYYDDLLCSGAFEISYENIKKIVSEECL
jgi:hypothetical protein